MLAGGGRLQFSDPAQHLRARSTDTPQVEIAFGNGSRVFAVPKVVAISREPLGQTLDVIRRSRVVANSRGEPVTKCIVP